jgi:hypothetical protein
MRTAPAHVANVFRAAGRSAQAFSFPEAAFRVLAGGREAGEWRGAPRQGWDEIVLRVPGALVTGREIELTLRGRYASFHFWFLQ